MFTLFNQTGTADLFCDHSEEGCLQLAVADLAGDIERICAVRPAHKRFLPRDEDGFVLIGNVQNPVFRAEAERHGLDMASLEGRWEAYRIQTFGENDQNLLLCGSDERGAMWAVYEFTESFLGIDPVGFWTDHEPERRACLEFEAINHEDAPKTFRYRGWFLNDEDLLTEWKNGGGKRYIDYRFYQQVMHPDVMARVLETALRLKQNLIIPASFLDIANPAEENLVRMAAGRGLFVTQHHIEPLGVSHFALENYWKSRGVETPPSFVTERDKIMETWTWYARKWAAYGDRVLWQLGLRGRGDRAVWNSDPNVPDTDEGRGALISEAMECQRKIVAEATGRNDFVCSTTLWAEGTALHQAGHLKFPADTIVVFADNLRIHSRGLKAYAHQWASDFYSVQRQPQLQYGIYYHVAVWSPGPHLAQGVPVEKIATCFEQAVEKGDTAYAITNVTNIREVIVGLSAVAALTHDQASFKTNKFLNTWCARQFGPAAEKCDELYQLFSAAYAKVKSDAAAHPALIHDGVIRGHAKLLLLALFKVAEIIPDRRLARMGGGFDGDAPPPFEIPAVVAELSELSPLLQDSLPQWRALLRRIRETAREIPQNRRFFYDHHFRTQAEIMTGLTEWALALGRAFQAASEKQGYKDVTHALDDATHAIGTLLSNRERSETGRWINWYRGDRKMDLRGGLKATRQVMEAYALKAPDVILH